MIQSYEETRKIIESHFSSRLSFNKVTQDVYFDGSPFLIGHFREVVFQELDKKVLDNDKYIYEITYLYAKKNSFSPVEDYLNICAMKCPEVDYRDVFKQLNREVLHIDPDSLESLYLPKTLVAAVKRIYEAGSQHDSVLVLKGGQGFYKTSFFRELAGHEWFTSTTFRSFNTDELMVCHSKWFIELEEIEGTIRPSTMSKLKGFITKLSDTFRKPYAKNPIDLPRQFVLVGTTNQDKFLQDATGNRRFWVIELSQEINIDWVKQNRDLIWAAATKAYKDNYPTYLTKTEQELSNSVNAQKFQVEDIWVEPVTNWVMSRAEPFTFTNVMEQALTKQTGTWKANERDRVKNILKFLGLKSPEKTTRYNGISGKWYQPLTTKIEV
jgi:predicted P-loop ATPase